MRGDSGFVLRPGGATWSASFADVVASANRGPLPRAASMRTEGDAAYLDGLRGSVPAPSRPPRFELTKATTACPGDGGELPSAVTMLSLP